VAVVGGTGVIGASVVPALLEVGHEVVGLARTPEKVELLERLGAEATLGELTDHEGLVGMFAGADAVCNFATRVPVGYSGLWPPSWRTYDWLRTDGVRRVVVAARAAGVRRVVQESVSFLYADAGDQRIDEDAPLSITRATEPASVGESHVQEFANGSRAGVVLRLGSIVGDDPMTRFQLKAVRHGRPIGLGRPDGWMHVVHTDDLGGAVLAALGAPSGTYNVGAEPVRRADLVAGFAAATGRSTGRFLSPAMTRMAGVRLEPLTRSLRVSSQRLAGRTGWRPVRPTLDAAWFDAVTAPTKARS
jgi:nucleoside-diphosphate-sugar epimerase